MTLVHDSRCIINPSIPRLLQWHIFQCWKRKKKKLKRINFVQMQNSVLVNFLLFHFVTTTILHTATVMSNGHGHRQRWTTPCVFLTIYNIPVWCLFLCGIRAHHHIKPYSSFRCSFFFWSRFENPKIQTLHVECITTIYDDDGGINHCVFLVKLMFAWSIFPSFLSLTLAQCWLSQPSFAFTLLGFCIVCELHSFFYICAVSTENMEWLSLSTIFIWCWFDCCCFLFFSIWNIKQLHRLRP